MLPVCIIVCILLAGIDQLTKYFAVMKLSDGTVFHAVTIGDLDILKFQYYENTGAAFSSLQGKIPLLLAITVIMIGGMIFWLIRYKPTSKFLIGCIITIIGGGIGNMIDRVRLGYVVDFLILKPFTFIFNFADICVVLGAIFLFLWCIVSDMKPKPKTEESNE